MKRIINLLIIGLMQLTFAVATAQIVEPAKWDIRFEQTNDTEAQIVATMSIEPGWHVYSNDVNPEVGPYPLQISWDETIGVKPVGELIADTAPHTQYDEMFGANLSWWTGSATVRQKLQIISANYKIGGEIVYSACNDANCIPPTKVPFSFTGQLSGQASANIADGITEESKVTGNETRNTYESAGDNELWNAVDVVKEQDDSTSSKDLLYLFGACFLGGLLALLTPCVWPMIPMTVSYFLKKNKSRSKAIADAIVYGVSIIVIYLVLGLAVSALFGPQALNELATGAVCNIIFFLLLVVFALSFFGAFEISLPEKWRNKVDTKAESATGLMGIFFMAFTLTLVSFSCTGPIIGTLLVEAATSGTSMAPLVGMFGFSLALAIPFCLFAMFPSWLNSAPKSGNWMNTVKVVLGFIELALSLKFLSVADLAYGWHILDREVFIALWIVMFSLLGAYLMGWFEFKHYYTSKNSGTGIPRFVGAMASFTFAVYLLPGLWGAPLKGVSAFVPPLYTQDFNLYGDGLVEYSDYEQGMEQARIQNKPALIDFSGYGCVNCRKMESAVLDNDEIKSMLAKDFIIIKLMVDDKRPLPHDITVEENGKDVVLKTYGDKWSYLQRHKFNANAQPYYLILSPDGKLLSGPYSYNENIDDFRQFLMKAL